MCGHLIGHFGDDFYQEMEIYYYYYSIGCLDLFVSSGKEVSANTGDGGRGGF